MTVIKGLIERFTENIDSFKRTYKDNRTFFIAYVSFGLAIFALIFVVSSYLITQNEIDDEVQANRSVLCDVGRLVQVSSISDMDRLPGETLRNFRRRLVIVERFTERYREIDCKGFGFTTNPRNRKNGENGNGSGENGNGSNNETISGSNGGDADSGEKPKQSG